MNDRPTAGELLEAVAEFLSAEVVPALDGKLRYNARVAAHVVEIVGREIALEDDQLLAEWQRLNELSELDGSNAPDGSDASNASNAPNAPDGSDALHESDSLDSQSPPDTRETLRSAIRDRTETLVEQIRAGKADEGPWRDALMAHLKQTVADKLQVAKG
jgi:hypothetical protein